MSLLSDVQTKLDEVLLPDGVLSFHLRRTAVATVGGEAAQIDDAYVVYRFSPARPTWGDGKPLFDRYYINVSYYFKNDKNTANSQTASDRMDAVKAKFLADPRYQVANDKMDIPDDGSGYVGINVEFIIFKLSQ